MADPLNVAGLALSVTSLTFELFSGCVKGLPVVALMLLCGQGSIEE